MSELDLNTPEGQAAFEAEANLYSTITLEANEIAPLLNQTFKVQFKGSNEAHKALYEGEFNGITYTDTRGKEFDAELEWGHKTRPVIKVHNFFGKLSCSVYPENLRQIGLLPKMLDAHRKAYGDIYL